MLSFVVLIERKDRSKKKGNKTLSRQRNSMPMCIIDLQVSEQVSGVEHPFWWGQMKLKYKLGNININKSYILGLWLCDCWYPMPIILKVFIDQEYFGQDF